MKPFSKQLLKTIASEKKLFNLVDAIGETLEGALHIIDITDEYPIFEGDRKYRVYHKNGYCFDIDKLGYEDDQTGEVKGHEYNFVTYWDDFKPLSIETAIKLIKSPYLIHIIL